MKKKTPPEAPEWFQAYEERQNAFNTEVIKRLDTIEKDVVVLKEDMIEVKKDVAAIKECSTIKKELKENK